VPRRYDTEIDARAELETYLAPYFDLYSEVRLLETGQPFQFIDYVAVFKDADAQSSLRLIGIEAKSGFDEVKDGCAVIKQCMRYRKAKISDSRLTQFLGDRIPYIAVWPRIDFQKDTSWCDSRPNGEIVRADYLGARRGEQRALELLAQHWNIGFIQIRPWWSQVHEEWHPSVTLMNGQQQVWTSRYIQQIAEGFRGGLKLATDPNRGLRFLD
jgi:hypothetical protein